MVTTPQNNIPTPVLDEMLRKAKMRLDRQKKAVEETQREYDALVAAYPKERA